MSSPKKNDSVRRIASGAWRVSECVKEQRCYEQRDSSPFFVFFVLGKNELGRVCRRTAVEGTDCANERGILDGEPASAFDLRSKAAPISREQSRVARLDNQLSGLAAATCPCFEEDNRCVEEAYT